MFQKSLMTDEDYDRELEQLRRDPDVRLARAYQALDYAKRNYLYQLRNLKKKGAVLREKGVTMETLRELSAEIDEHEDEGGAEE